MNIKRVVFLAVLVVAIAALAMPLAGLRAAASGSGSLAGAAAPKARPASPVSAVGQQQKAGQQKDLAGGAPVDVAPGGRFSPETMKALGLNKVANPKQAASKIEGMLRNKNKGKSAGDVSIQSGQPLALNAKSALSDALILALGGRDNQFSEVTLIADWDGREDCAADREQKVDDFSFVEPDIDFELTRTAVSEHTVANGFNENVYYYGDSVGNVWVGVDTNPTQQIGAAVDTIFQINLPTVLNAFGTINGDDQVVITGLAVNPVADLGSFSHVNSSFSPTFGPTAAGTPGVIGEILYVSYTDTEGGGRLVLNPSTGVSTIVRSGVLAFPISDVVSPAPVPPGVISSTGFPVTVGGAFGVAFSVFSNLAGVAVDDDGSVYFQQVDLIQFTGANLVKIASVDDTGWQDRSLATNGFNTLTTLNPTAGRYADASGPLGGGVSQINRFTNYSGTSTLFGDIVAINTGPCNVLYAAVSRSFVAGAVSFEQLTEGLFPAPSAFANGTPSMVISFADCSGAFDVCSGEATGSISTNVGGTLPIADGFADPAAAGLSLPRNSGGVNNFRIFVEGGGPDLAPAVGGTAVVPGTPSSLLRIVDLQVDYIPAHAGLAVSNEGTVFVISGGGPAGVGKSPSPMLGEVLCFEDICPSDRRADFVDLRGDVLPNPPASGGNVGDGDSDRFDHIFYQAPIDVNTATPAGLTGLNFGFLRYTNRLAPNAISPGVTLGQTGGQTVLGDDDTTAAAIFFEHLDPGHQVAGGDDQNTPFRGDDDNGAGSPNPIPAVPNTSAGGSALNGGFEFLFGGPVGTAGCVWNGFFLNSNGNITFGSGDTDNTPTVPEFRAGLPKIAPAWTDLNPNARAATLGDFPVMALGFANVNAFKIRFINVPQFSDEGCTAAGSGLSNTFSITLYDDGTGIDENASQPLNPANPIGNNSVAFDLQEGPTDLRFVREPATSVLVGCSPRPEGSGIFGFEYCRMDLLGTSDFPVIAGYSIGGLDPLNPPGLCETNLSVAAAQADAGTFGVLAGGQIAAIGCNCCIGEGTEPTIFELFNEGAQAGTGAGGEITFSRPDFDLRFEGNDAAICTSTRQRDLNRGKVCFLGVGCAPPANARCQTVVPVPFTTTPTTTGLVNSLCAVQLNLVGCGFFPNEVTTICQGFAGDTGVPLQRPGKTVTTAATLSCDTNGDGIAETTVALTTVTPVSCNRLTAVIPVSGAFGSTSSSGFPAACCGGAGTITVTTTFTDGDNNIFGPFTRTTVCSLALGTRAPVVFSVTPSGGDCSLPDQDLLISGACFQINGVTAVTSVFAQDISNPANIIQAKAFVVLNANLIDAHFTFGSANAGKTFLIFVTGPGGTSRNLTTLPAGSPAGCALGNEQGIQVTFKCNAPGTPTGPGTPLDVASVTGCKLDRQANGTFFLDVTGTKIKDGAVATVGGIAPKKIKVVEVESGTTNPTKLRLIKKVCSGLPGNVVITNPGAAASQPFLCTERCPGN